MSGFPRPSKMVPRCFRWNEYHIVWRESSFRSAMSIERHDIKSVKLRRRMTAFICHKIEGSMRNVNCGLKAEVDTLAG
jgi:hypothetical protein